MASFYLALRQSFSKATHTQPLFLGFYERTHDLTVIQSIGSETATFWKPLTFEVRLAQAGESPHGASEAVTHVVVEARALNISSSLGTVPLDALNTSTALIVIAEEWHRLYSAECSMAASLFLDSFRRPEMYAPGNYLGSAQRHLT